MSCDLDRRLFILLAKRFQYLTDHLACLVGVGVSSQQVGVVLLFVFLLLGLLLRVNSGSSLGQKFATVSLFSREVRGFGCFSLLHLIERL